jgi:hypothetical protein
MSVQTRGARTRLRRALVALVFLSGLVGTTVASAGLLSAPKKISEDAFNNSTSQHHSEVEPDTFAFGNSVVATFQEGRFFNGGASGIGFATSTNGGHDWGTKGVLPGLTVYNKPAGPFERASDPAVAFDSVHDAWLINSLALDNCGGASCTSATVVVSRSTDGARHWSAPVTVDASPGDDKNWIVCDNGSASPHNGTCYVAWDNGGGVQVSRSTDGGLTWGAAVATGTGGVGVQPVTLPDGTLVIVFLSGPNQVAVRSTDGGLTFSPAIIVAPVTSHHPTAMRALAVPSVEADAAGTVYVAWHDCAFRVGCSSNDIVISSSSTGGLTWTPKAPVPIDAATSGVDHFLPGLGVDPATSGATGHLGLTYYFFPDAACTFSTCELDAGFISSSNGGATWSAAGQLNQKPMALSWLADTNQGRMVGDYISTSFSNGVAVPVFALAEKVSGGGTDFHEAMYAVQRGVS